MQWILYLKHKSVLLNLTLTSCCTVGLFGCSLFMAGQVIVHSYFHKRRTISSALAAAGTAVGKIHSYLCSVRDITRNAQKIIFFNTKVFFILAMFVWPPLTRYLIDTYSWRGASLIMGGICLNGLVAGSLLRPPPMKKVYKVKLVSLETYLIIVSICVAFEIKMVWISLYTQCKSQYCCVKLFAVLSLTWLFVQKKTRQFCELFKNSFSFS